MKNVNIFKQIAAGAALTASLGFASTSAMAQFDDFTVDPAGAGTGQAPFVADKITGNYVEVITFTPTGPGGGTFAVSLKWEAGQFVALDGTDPLPGITTGLGNNYGLYALYMGTGTYTNTVGGGATFTADPGVGSISMGIDGYAGVTTFTAPLTGAGAWTLGMTADDTPIATGVPGAGAGELDPSLPTCNPGINCGSFGTSTTFALNPAGMAFFTAPTPFYNMSFQSGQLNNFVVAGTVVINGSLDVIFRTVPAPTSIALMGLGLSLLGFGARRRK